MDLQFLENTARQRFEVHSSGNRVGFIDYLSVGEALDLTHTEVDPALEGQGIGAALVEWALERMRERGQKAIPSCPFVMDYLKRHPDAVEVVHN